MLERETDLTLLHPACVGKFTAFALALDRQHSAGEMRVHFRPFETYRSPQRQRYLLKKGDGATKAGPWQSDHQYGMAVDFVAQAADGKWSWDSPKAEYSKLRRLALTYGLVVPITWDPGHVVLGWWHHIEKEIKRRTELAG